MEEGNKNKKLLISIVALALIGIIGVTIAYFSSSADFINIFKTSEYNTQLSEEFIAPDDWTPGTTTDKVVSVKNTGTIPMAVRVSIEEEWKSKNGTVLSNTLEDGSRVAILNFANEADWIEHDGYYYYGYVLNPEEETTFINSVTFNENTPIESEGIITYTYTDGTTSTGNTPEEGKTVKKTVKSYTSKNDGYAGATYKLKINIETVQYDSYKEHWKLGDEPVIKEEKPKKGIDIIKENNEIALDNVRSTYVDSDTGINFGKINSTTNGQGIYIRAGTENDEHPIYYFRGDTTLNNNVLFANFCWKIVRTTETGGIKLIYNGAPSNNQCTNTTGETTQIGTSGFNSGFNRAKYVGYMYDDSSNDIAQHGTTSSTIKIEIDKWFKTNLTNEEDSSKKDYRGYLEDAVWCNDRKINSTDGSDVYYETDNRLEINKATSIPLVKDEEVCTQQSDRYTLPGNSKGNGALTYSVGLLTADEAVLAGGLQGTSNSTYYLYTNRAFWVLSPVLYAHNGYAQVFLVNSSGQVYSYSGVDVAVSVRPSVSLGLGTTFTGGDGSMETPYIVAD